MELSRFSKQFKMLGGGALLVLAYAPMFLGSFGEKGDFLKGRGDFLSSRESVFGRTPIFQARLTVHAHKKKTGVHSILFQKSN